MQSFPPSWSNFATSLKHKRQEFLVSDLIGSFDVEEKVGAKDTRARVTEAGSSAHVVQKRNYQEPHKSKNYKNKSVGKGKCRRICIVDRRQGSSSLGLTEGVKGSIIKVGIVHDSLPSFRSCYGGKILRAAITHYKADRRDTGYNEY